MAHLSLSQLARGGVVKSATARRVDVGKGLLDLQGEPTEMGTTGPTCGVPLDLSKITSNQNIFVNFVMVNGAAVPLNWSVGGAQSIPAVSALYGVNPATLAAGNALFTDQIAGIATAGGPKTNGFATRVAVTPVVVKEFQVVCPVANAAQRAVPLNTFEQNYNLDVCTQTGESVIDWTNANGLIRERLIALDQFRGLQYQILPASAISINLIISLASVPTMANADGSC